MPIAAIQRFIAQAAEQRVLPLLAQEKIGAGIADEQIMASATAQDIGREGTHQHVIAAEAPDVERPERIIEGAAQPVRPDASRHEQADYGGASHGL